jgi:copper ion binding protein
MKRISLDVQGMTCNHCVHHVTEALKDVPGVQSVAVSLEKKQAVLEVGDAFSETAAASAIADAGYTMGAVAAV